VVVEPGASRFWQAAIKSGLVDAPRLLAAWDQIPESKRTAEAIDRRLARRLVDSKVLTLWQAEQIFAGRGIALRLDRYELQGVLGSGGMGRVYLARDAKLGRRVAIKILSKERMNNPRAIARFQREARVGAQLQHENLVRIYDEGDAQGVRFLVMEYIEGRTVGRILADEGPLPPAVAARLARQVALGLEHAQQKGLIHRDVNPQNILVMADGTAKLTDLGLAIDLGEAGEAVTRDGSTVGTFDYISPEQARHSRNVDTRTDVYSLGCTLFHMIAGRVPFPAASLPEKLYAHQLTDPEPLSTLVERMPAGLDAVVRRMMRKAPEDRYQTPAEAAEALAPFAVGGPKSAQSPPAPPAEPPAADPGRNGSALAPEPAPATTPQSPGTDADLAWVDPAPAPAAPKAAAAGSADEFGGLLAIDLGPEPPLSSSAGSGVRARSRPVVVADLARSPTLRRAMAIAAGVVVALLILGALGAALSGWLRGDGPSAPAPTEGGPAAATQSTTPPPPAATPAVAVRLPDGRLVVEADLPSALKRAAGARGVVELGDDPPPIGPAGLPLRLATGDLTIRAAAGCRPLVWARLDGDQPLFFAGPSASLRLEGLAFVVEGAGGSAAPLVRAVGRGLAVDRCSFRRDGGSPDRPAVAAEVAKLDVRGCSFWGFGRALAIGLFPGAEAVVSHCQVASPTGAEQRGGWALRLSPRSRQGPERPRKIAVDRLTVVGGGLVECAGFAAGRPLALDVTGTALQSQAVLMWDDPATLANGLAWTGRDNAYDVRGLAWVVRPPAGFDGLEGSPDSLTTWDEAPWVKSDEGSRQRLLAFARPGLFPGSSPPAPGDLGLGGDDAGSTLGADPDRVGPGASAASP